MGRLTTYISLSLAVSQAYAGCQPQIAFAPPKLTADSLKGTFDHIKSTIDGLAKSGVFKKSSFSLQIASSTEDLFSLSHAADTPFIRGTKNVDKSSVYRVASNSKLFTALAILRLEAAGKLSLDHSVTTHVPGLQNSPTIDWSKITIRSLLSHLSGIPDSFAQEDLLFELADPSIYGLPAFPANTTSDFPKCENFSNNTKTCTEQELVAYLAKTPTVFAPRVEPSYSNNGFALLGQVVANVAGQSYEEHIASTIFKPLNMTKSSFTAPNESSAVIPEHSYFGMDLGVGNPSGGLYSTTSDMIKFLQYALVNSNKITQSMDWFALAAHGPGSHSSIGYPWEIFRSGSILPNNTRAVTFNTKGGGLDGYYSYSIVIPNYDLVVFMAVGGDLTALNAVFDAVRNPLVAGAERVAQDSLAATYAGRFEAKTGQSSMTIAQSDAQSLFLESWTSNSKETLPGFVQMVAVKAGQAARDMYFQFLPTFETRTRQDGAVGEVWRFINVIKDGGREPSGPTVWTDYCIGNIDPIRYGAVSFNEAVFWRRNGTKMQEVELPALRISLLRV